MEPPLLVIFSMFFTRLSGLDAPALRANPQYPLRRTAQGPGAVDALRSFNSVLSYHRYALTTSDLSPSLLSFRSQLCNKKNVGRNIGKTEEKQNRDEHGGTPGHVLLRSHRSSHNPCGAALSRQGTSSPFLYGILFARSEVLDENSRKRLPMAEEISYS